MFSKYEMKLLLEDKSYPLKCKKDEFKSEEFWNNTQNMLKFINIVHGTY